MAYKYTFNRDYNYLAHFNKNHDPKDGRFTFGDGDGIPNNKNISDAKTATDEYKKALNNIHVDKKSANEMLDYMEENCGISNDTSKNRFQRIKDMCDDEELFELICMETIDDFINKKLADNKELMLKEDHNDTDYMNDTYIRIEKELEDLSHSRVDDTSYLIHFNKNHDPKNGQFTFGDGDGDGQINDRAQRKNFKQFKKDATPGLFRSEKGSDSYKLSEDYEKNKQNFINKAKKSATSGDLDDLGIDQEIDRQFGKYADIKINGLSTGDSARSFIKNMESKNLERAVDEKLLKDNGYEINEKYGYISKIINGGIEIQIGSANKIKDGLAVEKSIEKNKSKLDKEKDRILTEELVDWGDNDLSKQTKGFGLQYVYVYEDGETAEANYWWDGPGDDPIGGHEIGIEFDVKTGKPIGYSVNG